MRLRLRSLSQLLAILLLAPLLNSCGGNDDPAPAQGGGGSSTNPPPAKKPSAQLAGPATCANPVMLDWDGHEAIDLPLEPSGRYVTESAQLYVLESKDGQQRAFFVTATPKDETGVSADLGCREIPDGLAMSADHLSPPPYEISASDGMTLRELELHLNVKKDQFESSGKVVSTGETPEEREEKEAFRLQQRKERGAKQERLSYKVDDTHYEIRLFERETLEDGTIRQSSMGYRLKLVP